MGTQDHTQRQFGLPMPPYNVHVFRDEQVHVVVTTANHVSRSRNHHTVCARRLHEGMQRIDASVPVTCVRCHRIVTALGDLAQV